MKNLLFGNAFIKSLSVLMAGTALSNILIFAATPILTRLYTPAEFGSLSVFLSIVYTIQIMTSLRYETAIPLPEKAEDAYHLFVLSLLLVIGVSGLTLIVTLTMPIAEWFSMPELSPYIGMLAASVLGIGLYQVWNLWSIRIEAYPEMSRAKVMMNSGQVISQAFLGLFNLGAFGLLLGEVIGRFSGTLSYSFKLRKKVMINVKLSKRKMFEVLKRYKSFPLVSSWSSLLGGVGEQLPIFFLAALFDAKTVGLFFLAQKILTVPEGMLGFSASQVYLSQSAKESRKSFEEFKSFFWDSTRKVVVIGFIMIGGVVLFAPPLINFVFGEEWVQSGVYLKLLAVFFLVKIVVNPMSANFYVFEALKIQLIAEVIRFAFVVCSLLLAAKYNASPTIAIMYMSVVGSVGHLVYGFFAWFVMKRNYTLIKKTYSKGEGALVGND